MQISFLNRKQGVPPSLTGSGAPRHVDSHLASGPPARPVYALAIPRDPNSSLGVVGADAALAWRLRPRQGTETALAHAAAFPDRGCGDPPGEGCSPLGPETRRGGRAAEILGKALCSKTFRSSIRPCHAPAENPPGAPHPRIKPKALTRHESHATPTSSPQLWPPAVPQTSQA